ncbi:Piso0_003676 [Millerozyma farinosa CBS 7064]|uniref:Piso0_003676 protein n=1 Tax=Pichia sorbitophila (strain ATCC MYA-4447 / BCRC 22081 / CBS 7064 / NBRC 10061 / NRRL Y-12695) TaxID=559304 RepID=G8Y6A5_PICSO|nr:Piso0_003676 [Millerozyma farinosa CBS 7064]CCE84135.1 Piso0_003676 [Millerozyma farinosa CBS 7064]
MSSNEKLNSFLERENIKDSIYCITDAFDQNNFSLMESVCDKNMTFDLNGFVIQGLEEIRNKSLNVVGPMDTTHTVSNVRVDIKSDRRKATATANAISQHFPAGQGQEKNAKNFLAGTRYYFELAKDEAGSWKIEKYVLKIIWTQGDISVMQPSD